MDSNQPIDHSRPDSDLLGSVAGSDVEQSPTGQRAKSTAVDFGMSTVREQVESDVHYLLSSNKLAILLAREWHVIGMPHAFEHMEMYREVAKRSNCDVVTVTRPEGGGLESFLFLTRIQGLPDEDYLACVETLPGALDVQS